MLLLPVCQSVADQRPYKDFEGLLLAFTVRVSTVKVFTADRVSCFSSHASVVSNSFAHEHRLIVNISPLATFGAMMGSYLT